MAHLIALGPPLYILWTVLIAHGTRSNFLTQNLRRFIVQNTLKHSLQLDLWLFLHSLQVQAARLGDFAAVCPAGDKLVVTVSESATELLVTHLLALRAHRAD